MLMLKANSILDEVKEINANTYDHLERTAMFTFALGKALKFNPEQLELAYFAGLLHDVGIIEAKEHDNKIQKAIFGSLMLKYVDGFEIVSKAIRHQYDFHLHENSEFSLLLSKIIAIASEYDELRNDKGLSHLHAVKSLKEKDKFEKDMVDSFSNILELEELI